MKKKLIYFTRFKFRIVIIKWKNQYVNNTYFSILLMYVIKKE